MQAVKLETEAGELVQEGETLPFEAKPTVVTWGLRTFVFDRTEYPEGAATVDVYRERFTVALVKVKPKPDASVEGGFLCPRRGEGLDSSVFTLPASDHWRPAPDGTCSFCGSLNPDAFMARVEAGDVQLVPTDKSYKVYVENSGGEAFKRTFRDCPRGATCTGPNDCTHWVTREQPAAKFYFQHLSTAQRHRFIELMNEGRLKLAYPGHFYVLPFFAKRG